MRTAIKGALLATGALLASAGTTTTPAVADETAADQTLTFDKGDSPINGRIVWTSDAGDKTWRAGSGNGANWSNECVTNEGHLPNGRYQILDWHENYDGEVIHGRAIHLEDKQCTDGTWRRELFVHSEQTVNNEQGDTEGTRWDGEEDYKSEACVKMHPTDLAELYYKSAQPEAGPRPTVMTVVS
jgi:hypothetical protein